jgi:hypothetical protein
MDQAARAVGKAKSTISKDVRRGRISATRNPDGSVSIDASELFRVYSPTLEQATGTRTDHANDRQPPKTESGNGFDREQLLERIAEQAATIRNLWQRLDTSEAERRAEAEGRREAERKLTAVLSDLRPAQPAAPAERPPAPAEATVTRPADGAPDASEDDRGVEADDWSEVQRAMAALTNNSLIGARGRDGEAAETTPQQSPATEPSPTGGPHSSEAERQPAQLAKSSLVTDPPTAPVRPNRLPVPGPPWWRRWFR